jgi:PPK2 family polyphosphate:nucleotide phosphotransferase
LGGNVNDYRVKPGKQIKLEEWDPNSTAAAPGNKKETKHELLNLNLELDRLQELLYAEHKHKMLIVLQGMDTSGKDGTIRHVFEGVNPQGVRVASFKIPTQEELEHDYLWRIHKQTPGSGMITIFNRSHYEDVLVVRVHNLVPENVWSKRFAQINNFERLLSEEGTTILKFYLHIDLAEQKSRLQARLDDPTKHWKFNLGDLQERKRWVEYIQAYEDVLSKTSTRWAPWYIVPANRKWYRNFVIAKTIIDTLKSMDLKYPEPEGDLSNVVVA